MQVRLRHIGYAASVACLVLPLVAWASHQGAARTARVTVQVRCTAGQTFISVDPWVLELNVGDSADWWVQPSSTVYSVDVAPKHGSWPFQGNPQHGNGSNPARSGGPANARGHHKYSITAICGTQDQPGQTVVIDPDMDIK